MWQNELEAMIAAGGAPCRACGQRMLKADGCTWTHVKCGNRYYRRIKYGEDGMAHGDARCHDCGADVLVLHVDLDGIQPLGIVGAHGTDDDDVLAVVGAVYTQSGVQADHKGTDVQGGILLVGDPVPLQLDQLRDAGQGQILGDLGQGDTLSRVVHPADIVHGAEQLDGAVIGAVGLQALKDLLGVVEHLGRRIDLEGSIGDDAGVVPALAGVIVHDEHMIGHALAEHQSGGLGLLLQSLSAGDLDLLHNGTAS